MSNIRNKRTALEYSYRPATNPGQSYQDFMLQIPDNHLQLKKLQKHSEFKKPYYSDSYEDMEYQWDGYHHYDFFPYNINAPDVPEWPTPNGPDYGGGADGTGETSPTDYPCSDSKTNPTTGATTTRIFHAWTNDNYCLGLNNLVTVYTTQPCLGIIPLNPPFGSTITAGCNTINIFVPGTPGDIGPVLDFEVYMLDSLHPGAPVTETVSVSTTFDCPACLDSYIVHTTHQMSVNGTQDLSVGTPTAGATYTWLVTGGGSVSPDTGTSTTYTAPASNGNCANNATITLKCGTEVCDSISIAINGYTPVTTAFQHGTGLYSNCFGDFIENCGFDMNNYKCDGSIRSTVPVGSQKSPCGGCINHTYLDCKNIPHSYAEWVSAFYDCRSNAEKAGGCCPYELL